MELRDVPQPTVGHSEVLVRVRAAGLNPVDHKIRQGKLRLLNRIDLPRVAGSELAGVVEEVGAAVTRFAVGDRVFARVDKKHEPRSSKCSSDLIGPLISRSLRSGGRQPGIPHGPEHTPPPHLRIPLRNTWRSASCSGASVRSLRDDRAKCGYVRS
jgi:hypothetical protein